MGPWKGVLGSRVFSDVGLTPSPGWPMDEVTLRITLRKQIAHQRWSQGDTSLSSPSNFQLWPGSQGDISLNLSFLVCDTSVLLP